MAVVSLNASFGAQVPDIIGCDKFYSSGMVGMPRSLDCDLAIARLPIGSHPIYWMNRRPPPAFQDPASLPFIVTHGQYMLSYVFM